MPAERTPAPAGHWSVGGALYSMTGSVALTDCTLSQNQAFEGGAIAKGGFPADLFVKYIAGLKQSQASTG